MGTAEQRGAGVRDAEVTIVGGGAVGCAVAYILSRAGYADIQVIEQGELAGATSGQAASHGQRFNPHRYENICTGSHVPAA